MIVNIILGIIGLVILIDLLILIVRAWRSSGAGITSALCYVFGVIPLPSLFFSVVFRLLEGTGFGVILFFLIIRFVK